MSKCITKKELEEVKASIYKKIVGTLLLITGIVAIITIIATDYTTRHLTGIDYFFVVLGIFIVTLLPCLVGIWLMAMSE